MKKWLVGFVVGVIVLGNGFQNHWIFPPPITQAQINEPPNQSEDNPTESNLKIQIYDVPKTFSEGYVTILSEFITTSDEIRYPQNATDDETLSEATETVEADLEEETEVEPIEYVQYDPNQNIIVVLATASEHRQIQQFLDQLKTKEQQKISVLYRVAMVERDIHPKLKHFPYEFHIKGKCWDEGRNHHKYPKWIDDRHEKFPNILFTEVETDREDDKTEFWVEGFAKSKKDVETIFQAVEQAEDTNSHTKMIHHDFMQESQENLKNVLGDIFPNSVLHPIIESLQKTEVYQVEAEAILASESSIPGFFRSVLGDDYGVEIVCEEGVKPNQVYNVEVSVFKKGHDRDAVFEDNNIHLSTSLITQFNQINMLGIRHHDDRYVLLFAMEKME